MVFLSDRSSVDHPIGGRARNGLVPQANSFTPSRLALFVSPDRRFADAAHRNHSLPYSNRKAANAAVLACSLLGPVRLSRMTALRRDMLPSCAFASRGYGYPPAPGVVIRVESVPQLTSFTRHKRQGGNALHPATSQVSSPNFVKSQSWTLARGNSIPAFRRGAWLPFQRRSPAARSVRRRPRSPSAGSSAKSGRGR